MGESARFHAPLLVAYAAFLCLPVYLFVIFYEEPTLHRQFGASYDTNTAAPYTLDSAIPKVTLVHGLTSMHVHCTSMGVCDIEVDVMPPEARGAPPNSLQSVH